MMGKMDNSFYYRGKAFEIDKEQSSIFPNISFGYLFSSNKIKSCHRNPIKSSR